MGLMFVNSMGLHNTDYPRRYEGGRREDSDVSNPRKVYVGNIPMDTREDEIYRAFKKYGNIAYIECKGKFAFVEYDSSRDAVHAMREMDGQHFLGDRIIVQPHKPGLRVRKGPPLNQVVPPPVRGRGPQPTGREKRTQHRVIVTNLDELTSWQDLKDFARNVGDVNFANVSVRHGAKIGVIEFYTHETMERAIKELDNRRLYDRRVRVLEDTEDGNSDGFQMSGSKNYEKPNGGIHHYEEVRGRSRSRDGQLLRPLRHRSPSPHYPARHRQTDGNRRRDDHHQDTYSERKTFGRRMRE